MLSFPPCAFDRERVVGGLGTGATFTAAAEAGHADRATRCRRRRSCRCRRAVDDHVVRLAIVGAEVDVQRVETRSCSMSSTVTCLRHRTAFRSTCSRPRVSIVMSRRRRGRARAGSRSRRQVDLLGNVGAVEDHRVGTGLALDDVAAVARIPHERVVAGAHDARRRCPFAVDRVVPGAADERLGAGAADERSSPSPPSIVVGMLSVKIPLDSSIGDGVVAGSWRRPRCPVTSARLKLNSAVPSLTMSTSSVPGWPFWRRSVIVSFALVPAIDSTPFWSLGSLIWDAMSSVAAALAGADAIPTAAATTAAEAASRAARRFLSRARLFMVSPLWNAMSVVGIPRTPLAAAYS